MGIEEYFDGGSLQINIAIIILPLIVVIFRLKEGLPINFKALGIITILFWGWFGYFYFIYNLTPVESLAVLSEEQSIQHYRVQRAIYNANKAIKSIEQSNKRSLQDICNILLKKRSVYSMHQCNNKYVNNAENLPYYPGDEMYNMKVANLIKYNRMKKRLMLYKSQFESVLPMLEINKNLKGIEIDKIQQEIFSNLKEFENSIRK